MFWEPLRYCKKQKGDDDDAETKKSLESVDKILKAHHDIGETNYVYQANPIWESINESKELKRLLQLVPNRGSFFESIDDDDDDDDNDDDGLVLNFPILQPLRARKLKQGQDLLDKSKQQEQQVQVVPWSESKGAIVVQVRFKDVINRFANFEDVLGEVAIPISKLIDNEEITGWFQVLEPGTTRVIRGSDDPGNESPRVFIRLCWKKPDEASVVSDTDREASIVLAEELIRSATKTAAAVVGRVDWIGNSIGALNTVRGLGGNVQTVQNTIGRVADVMETFRNLVNFTVSSITLF